MVRVQEGGFGDTSIFIERRWNVVICVDYYKNGSKIVSSKLIFMVVHFFDPLGVRLKKPKHPVLWEQAERITADGLMDIAKKLGAPDDCEIFFDRRTCDGCYMTLLRKLGLRLRRIGFSIRYVVFGQAN